MHTGKWLIVAMFVAGFAAAGSAWWHRLRQTDDALAFWTPAGVATINYGGATAVHHPADAAPVERDLTGTRGLPNVRHTLLQDLTFAVPRTVSPVAKPATYTLRFTHEDRLLEIHFDVRCQSLWQDDASQGLALHPQAAKYFRNYFAQQFATLK